MITLVMPTNGNPIALKRTIDSLKGVVDEVVVGDMCLFEKDSKIIKSYGDEIDLKIVPLPFNYIFCNGFSHALNKLAEVAKNDWIVYLNVGEVVYKGKDQILSQISEEYNCFYIDHPTETNHHWFRVYNKKEICWGGIIHEEIIGSYRPQKISPLFTFDDTEKDSHRIMYADILNSAKECVYFNLYLKLVGQPHLIANTNENWVQFSKEGYNSFIERLHKKGDMYEAFITGDYELLHKYINQQTARMYE